MIAISPINGVKINLGAGKKHIDGFINIDIYSEDEQEYFKKNNLDFYSGDAIEYISGLEDSSVEEVYTRHFLEHLTSDQMHKLLMNIERVLIKNGVATIIVPHWSNPYFYSDPTHVSFFGLYTFDYLTTKPFFNRKVPTYARISKLRAMKVSFKFIASKWLRPLTIPISIIVNRSKIIMEFYEANLSNIFPPYEIKYVLIKD